MIVSTNVSDCVKICQVGLLTILHLLICRGDANFGTRCRYVLVGSLCSGIVVYAMLIGRLPFTSPFKDEYHRQRMLRHIQKGLAPFHDREMAFLPSGKLVIAMSVL